MIERWGRWGGAVVVAAVALWTVTAHAEINAHRALYTMTLGTSRTDSGVTGAHGAMAYQWGETCDGWTVEQRIGKRNADLQGVGARIEECAGDVDEALAPRKARRQIGNKKLAPVAPRSLQQRIKLVDSRRRHRSPRILRTSLMSLSPRPERLTKIFFPLPSTLAICPA